MSHLGEQEVTFESIATLCEENQDELADLILQEVPFYSFIKTEATDEFDSAHGAQVAPITLVIAGVRACVFNFKRVCDVELRLLGSSD